MALTPRQRVLALVLTLVGGAAWWQQSRQVPETPQAPPGARVPDYTLERFTATTMGPDGRPARSLSAQELRHYPDDESSELDLPVLVLNRPDGLPWAIRSETGWISGDREQVWLHGPVFADREGRGEARPIHLKTSELMVRPRESYAETAMPVEITSDEDWLTSTGMQAWFAETVMRAHFLGRPRGRFAVQ
jgi:lipopolysaccharide export system protein LptC